MTAKNNKRRASAIISDDDDLPFLKNEGDMDEKDSDDEDGEEEVGEEEVGEEEVGEEEVGEEEVGEEVGEEDVGKEDVGKEDVGKEIKEQKDWPKDDDIELFSRIRSVCPKDDTMKYNSRVNGYMDWDLIKFKDYSAEHCKNRWIYVQSHQRHYRILTELLDDAMLWLEMPWYNFNKGGKKTKIHPDLPKRPLTSYMLFYLELQEKHPKMGMPELGKRAGKMFNDLSEKKKAKYSEMARKDKIAYEEKLRKFKEDHPDYVLPKQTTSKPPKVLTPYVLYRKEELVEFLEEGMTLKEASVQCRRNYTDLDDKLKLKWIKLAMKQKPAYDAEVEIFKGKNPDVHVPTLSLLTKDELEILKKSMGCPKKPPSSGFKLFISKKMTKQNKSMSEVSKLWNTLSKEEKDSYNTEAATKTAVYKKKNVSYLKSLTPEMLKMELAISGEKHLKRIAGKNDEPVSKRKKVDLAVAGGSSSSDMEKEEKVVPKAKNRESKSPPKSSASTKGKSLKPAEIPKKKASSAAIAIVDKSPKVDQDQSRRSAKPSLNGNASSITADSPPWAKNKMLFKSAGNLIEPAEPPNEVAAYYAMTYHSKTGKFTKDVIDRLWRKLPEKKKKIIISEHTENVKNYYAEYEKFLKSLTAPKELREYHAFLNIRNQGSKKDVEESEEDEEDESEEDEASDENEASGKSSEIQPDSSEEE